MNKREKIIFLLFLVIFGAGIFIGDYYFFQKIAYLQDGMEDLKTEKGKEGNNEVKNENQKEEEKESQEKEEMRKKFEELELLIREATAAVKEKTIVEKTTEKVIEKSSAPGSQVKENYIPLGSAKTSMRDWTDTAAEAYIDLLKYGKIKEINWEAVLRNPAGGGTIFARLINANDNIPIANSEVFSNSVNGERMSSGKIYLPYGNKLIRVQLKSSVGYEVVMDLGRIKIMTE